MAILDNDLEMSDAQAITSTDATASTDLIDLNATGRDILTAGKLVCVVNTTFDSAADNMTLTVVLETDDDVSFGSVTTLWTSATLAQATLVKGYKIFEAHLSSLEGKLERYIRFTYQCGTAVATAGKVDAYIVLDRQTA